MDTNALTHTADLTFQILTPVLAALGAWLAHRLVALFEKKSKMDIPAKQEEQITAWVQEAILLAAEKSRQKVVAQTSKLTGPEKLEEAAGFVLGFAQARGWDTWTKDMVKNKIEAAIGAHRANGGVPVLEDK